MQVDFGQRRTAINGESPGKVFLLVGASGYSRRVYAQAFRHERQTAWLEGIEGASRHFGGLPGELLLDNARGLLKHLEAPTREVGFTDHLHGYAYHSALRPIACAPNWARTKSEDERGQAWHASRTGRYLAPSRGGPLLDAGRLRLPGLIAAAGDTAGIGFLELFAAAILNPHRCRALRPRGDGLPGLVRGSRRAVDRGGTAAACGGLYRGPRARAIVADGKAAARRHPPPVRLASSESPALLR